MRNGNGSSQAEPKIGRSLELARKERGLSLHQVEEETKIRARYLRELERENFDVLPPVYVQGSLKTYANFLGLDGEALTRELKRQQPLEDDPEATTHIEPPKSEYLDRYLVSLGAADAETREMAEDEEIAGTAMVSADNGRLYLASAAFLVLALVAVVLVLTLPRSGQQEVSQVREPLISPAPEASRAGGEENNPISQQVADESDDLEARQQAASPDEDVRDDGEPAQGPRDATASSSATAAPETAAAEANATPAPTTEEPATTQPAPAASVAPVRDDQGVVGGLQARGPVGQEDEGPVKNFSITREKNTTMGDSSCPRRDGGLFEIRRGKKDPGACPPGNQRGLQE